MRNIYACIRTQNEFQVFADSASDWSELWCDTSYWNEHHNNNHSFAKWSHPSQRRFSESSECFVELSQEMDYFFHKINTEKKLWPLPLKEKHLFSKLAMNSRLLKINMELNTIQSVSLCTLAVSTIHAKWRFHALFRTHDSVCMW